LDLVGPWTVNTPIGKTVLKAFIAIELATCWFEIFEIYNKILETVMDVFHTQWLCCYPRPIQVIFDNGSEFKNVFK
jgi:hypothetical protein